MTKEMMEQEEKREHFDLFSRFEYVYLFKMFASLSQFARATMALKFCARYK